VELLFIEQSKIAWRPETTYRRKYVHPPACFESMTMLWRSDTALSSTLCDRRKFVTPTARLSLQHVTATWKFHALGVKFP